MTTLKTLQQNMKNCQLCLEAGHDIVPGAVFRGNVNSELMLIGQAPGITEVEVGRPFNAGSGRRLFKWLGQAGWDETAFRKRHYMTAVTKCYPGKHANGKGDRVPSKAEQALCRPFLEAEIRLVQPKVMILVGGLAIKLLFPKKARLNELVGKAAYFSPDKLIDPLNFDWQQAELLDGYNAGKHPDGRWVVPLPHPSGASLWPNHLENKALIAQAIKILGNLRKAFSL